ncbi:MAG: stage III sporulation protein AG [Oscillospiraceae bacterium]|nr:stage III sporulation protein AG [Oscillospiraceae bacterium]
MKQVDWKALSRTWLKRGKEAKWTLLVVLVGVILLCLPTGKTAADGEETAETEAVADSSEDFDLEAFEAKVETALAEIDGVGEVTVVLTLKSGFQQIYAANSSSDTDGDGGSESQTSVATVSTGSSTEEALEEVRLYPEFQGALVVCDGGNQASVRLAVTESIAALTGLSTEKISVCGRK